MNRPGGLLLSIFLAACGSAAWAEGTDNHVLHAVPAPGPVTVDGRLDEWDTRQGVDLTGPGGATGRRAPRL